MPTGKKATKPLKKPVSPSGYKSNDPQNLLGTSKIITNMLTSHYQRLEYLYYALSVNNKDASCSKQDKPESGLLGQVLFMEHILLKMEDTMTKIEKVVGSGKTVDLDDEEEYSDYFAKLAREDD
jgi:hypothetical protein